MMIITGASRGIGSFIFEYFRNEEVVGTYHLTKPPSENIDNYTRVNINSLNDINSWISEIKNRLSNITLINCAGINYNSMAHNADPEKWKEVIDINLVGTFNVIYAFLPFMRKQNFGRIINFSSIVANYGVPGTSAYAASKSGLIGLAKSIATENAKKNITINNLNLGYFNIGMISEVPEDHRNSLMNKIPSGKLGDPINIINAIEFIRNSDYINGSSIDINSGLY